MIPPLPEHACAVHAEEVTSVLFLKLLLGCVTSLCTHVASIPGFVGSFLGVPGREVRESVFADGICLLACADSSGVGMCDVGRDALREERSTSSAVRARCSERSVDAVIPRLLQNAAHFSVFARHPLAPL
eukprot:CAMPEP_0180144658 /NCGR_PEP_ID=MMETSP0986-20121125/17088_1 /TAXON_ID=697907 /ORGANISM="non described non described, Strain CCMP2293" /LENGTH=129 /DNA_ID=CAMNT_0022088651 /DNA_START=563 /DNA_END=953 /DNA_ORIENTATION=-